jgi:hypothetical protein
MRINTEKNDTDKEFSELAHLTTGQRTLIYVLWNWFFKTGRKEITDIAMSHLSTLLNKQSNESIYEEIWNQLKKIKVKTAEKLVGRNRVIYNFFGKFSLNENDWILSYQLSRTVLDGKIVEIPFKIDITHIEGLTAGQNNIICELMSHKPIKTEKYGGLFYHHLYKENFVAFANENGYLLLTGGKKQLETFFRDLDDLKNKNPTNPHNQKYPGFDYIIEENLFGEKTKIFLYLANTNEEVLKEFPSH